MVAFDNVAEIQVAADGARVFAVSHQFKQRHTTNS